MNKSIILALSLLSVVDASIPGDVAKPGFKPIQSAKRNSLGLCESDCDKDSDCKGGLICADEHKKELKAIGLDVRKANCYGETSAKTKYYEVCFKPSILRSGGAGGGKKKQHTLQSALSTDRFANLGTTFISLSVGFKTLISVCTTTPCTASTDNVILSWQPVHPLTTVLAWTYTPARK
jgi:hypothetical protein